jgi:hypothetical protein
MPGESQPQSSPFILRPHAGTDDDGTTVRLRGAVEDEADGLDRSDHTGEMAVVLRIEAGNDGYVRSDPPRFNICLICLRSGAKPCHPDHVPVPFRFVEHIPFAVCMGDEDKSALGRSRISGPFHDKLRPSHEAGTERLAG